VGYRPRHERAVKQVKEFSSLRALTAVTPVDYLGGRADPRLSFRVAFLPLDLGSAALG
jgi:hypothetical protein